MIGILIAGITSANAITIPKTKDKILPIQNTKNTLPKEIYRTSTGGNFSGQFAKKNESGYIILGSLEGTYNESGSFSGFWNTTDGNSSGTMSGWFWSHIFLGSIDLNNDSHWFIGLYRVNSTSNEFGAVALIFTFPWMIRYAAGTIS